MGSANTPESPTPRMTYHLILYNLPIRRNIQHHIWGLSSRRKILRHPSYHIISPYAETSNATYGVCQHTEKFNATWSNYPKLGQTGPRGPRPPNSDLKVPIPSNGPNLANLNNV
ncbi:unnamed protein product [Prunus brigantina]